MVQKMFIKIRLCDSMMYILKGIMSKSLMVKFNVSILNRLKTMVFVNTEYTHKHNVIFSKTVTKLSLFRQNVFFPYLNPTCRLLEVRLCHLVVFVMIASRNGHMWTCGHYFMSSDNRFLIIFLNNWLKNTLFYRV